MDARYLRHILMTSTAQAGRRSVIDQLLELVDSDRPRPVRPTKRPRL